MRILILLNFLFCFYFAQSMGASHSTCNVYFASALFSIREKSFNSDLVSHLENRHQYTLFLPQRDGFEFDNLDQLLAKKLDAKEVAKAEQLIIYYLDMGYYVHNSDVIVAILDEDLDPGVMVEITYARILGKHIIGIRTDVRSPYGQTPENGAHFFSTLQLDDFIYFNEKVETAAQIDHALGTIADIIHQKIEVYNQLGACDIHSRNKPTDNPAIQAIQNGARILFGNMTINEIKSKQGLDLIIKNYLENRQELEKIYPNVQLK